ncbi:hypothetical protein NQ538_10455 [Blautia hansenii DSM 20583]|nr:hypothetical protein [Blautia hansenii]UWO09695.1 hypothetical protein NQ538_10455 [Blautia hansenii DSM 20583]
MVISIYTILINENNELINTTPKERILQRSKLVDKLHFLTSPIYKDFDMTLFTATLEYVLPISKKYRSENLILSEELYKEQLEYILPIDTALTQEHGDIELQITFTYVHRSKEGQLVQHVRKTTPTTITITPIAAWSDLIPDDALTSLDQRLLKIDAMIQDLNEFNTNLDKTKADNISLEKNIIQLTSHGNKIGDAHLLPSGGNVNENGVPVVEFGNTTSRSVEVNKDIGYEVVEF